MSLWNKLFGRSPRETEEPAAPPRSAFPEPIKPEPKPVKPKPELAPLAAFPDPVEENPEALPPGLLPLFDIPAGGSASALDILTYPESVRPTPEASRTDPPEASPELPKLDFEPGPDPKAKRRNKAGGAPAAPGFAQIAKQARSLVAAKDPAGAQDLLREHIAQSPSAEAHTMLANMLVNHQQLEAALAQAEAGLAHFPESARLCALTGEINLKLGQQDAAEAAFQRALERDPPQAEAYQGLAELATLAQAWETAAQRWQGCLERFPADGRAPAWRAHWAEALLKQGQDAAAEPIYAELAEQHPERPLGEAGLAEVASHRANWEEAVERWQRCLERFPKHAYVPAWRGQYAHALMMHGQFAAAEAEYQALLKGSENPEEIHEKLAALAEKQGQFLTAAERVRACLNLCPQHKRAVRWRTWTGNLLIKQGKFDAAEAEFQALADQYPKSPSGAQGLERVQRWREQSTRKTAVQAKPSKARVPEAAPQVSTLTR